MILSFNSIILYIYNVVILSFNSVILYIYNAVILSFNSVILYIYNAVILSFHSVILYIYNVVIIIIQFCSSFIFYHAAILSFNSIHPLSFNSHFRMTVAHTVELQCIIYRLNEILYISDIEELLKKHQNDVVSTDCLCLPGR